VLDLAQPSCLIGSIADDGPEILQLIELVDRGAMGGDCDERPAFLRKLHQSAGQVWDPARGVATAAVATLPSPLTPRECDILGLIAAGQSNKAIARELGLGPETVKTHLKNVFLKLDVDRRTQAVLRAEELGLLRVHGRRRSS
jgi:LuxR family maltose regulon positive regulatory protein